MAAGAAVCLLLGLVVGAGAYNVDLDGWVAYRGPESSLFGFSVSAITDGGGGAGWVLVGAPQADTAQPGVTRAGAVYKCSAQPPGPEHPRHRHCQQVPFDLKGNHLSSGRTMDSKTDQWFGASVTSAPGLDNNTVVVACAPRYLWFSSNRKRREPVGTCYVAKNGFSKIEEYSPCRTDAWGYHRQGFCQAGFGSALSKDGTRLFIGAVGSWYWQGRLFSQSLLSRPELAGTGEGPSSEDDSYLGYSAAVGEFNGDADQDVVVGMPRGNNLTGKVLLYTSSLQSLVNITGDQIGSYFGYSLCVADLNGDQLDDVVIGAPFFTDFSNTEGNYETGRVVIAYQSLLHTFERQEHINGKVFRSRFGMAVTSLADIDLDGYDDMAVGAPNDGSDDIGAVYIYHGTRQGAQPEPSQVIHASELEPNLRSFGYSLYGGQDLDGNRYPDLVVGAHDSGAALYFRSRPVVHVQSSVRYQTDAGKMLDLSDPAAQCRLDDGQQVPCVSVLFCLSYDGVGVDQRAEFEVQFRLDTRRPRSPRLFFRDDVNSSRLNVTARSDRGRQWCHERFVFVEETVRDKLTPLVTEVHYSLVHRKPSRERGPLSPVLNLDRPPLATDSVSIQKDCGSDNVCVPDLKLAVNSSHATYPLGSSDRLTLAVTVISGAEDAFEAMFFLTVPEGVHFVGTERNNNVTGPQVLCSLVEGEDERLICDLGNPLAAGAQVRFLVHLMPQRTSVEMQRHYKFAMSVNSTNAERPPSMVDNNVTLVLPIRIHTELVVLGISQPEIVQYNSTRYAVQTKLHEREIGPELYHVYEISNGGPSEIVSAEAVLLWPSYTFPGGKHLLYLLEPPDVEGPGTCDPVPGLNPLQLQLPGSAAEPRTDPDDGAIVAPPYRRANGSDDAKFQAALGCGPTICTRIHCRIGLLSAKQNVIIRVRTRLWASTAEEAAKAEKIKLLTISSKLVARVTGLPHQVDPSYMNFTTRAVATEVLFEDEYPATVPWWVIVLSSCGGVLILLMLIFILYKVGFFRRSRRPAGRPAGVASWPGPGNGASAGTATYYAYQNVPHSAEGET